MNVLETRLEAGIRVEGPLSALGHNRRFVQPVSVRAESLAGFDSLDEAAVIVEGELSKSDLIGEPSDKDRREIVKRKNKDIFNVDRYPRFTFRGKYDQTNGSIEGELELRGRVAPVLLPVTLQKRAEVYEASGKASLDLANWGVKPYKALLGALKVSTVIDLAYTVRLEG